MLEAPFLDSAFFHRDALVVAEELIGAEILHGSVRVRIVETEAYRFPGDTANHTRMGKTARNAPMWGPAGHAYIYLCYGLHRMLNLVTGPEGHAAAVLVRGADPLEGLALIAERRKGRGLDGPGKVAEALGLSLAQSGSRLGEEIKVFPRRSPPEILVGPRVGIDYASEADRLAEWRFAMAGSRNVSARASLHPRTPSGASLDRREHEQ